MLDINIYDMLVFEDEAGNIYQDCVCDIIKPNKVSEDKLLLSVIQHQYVDCKFAIKCNNFKIDGLTKPSTGEFDLIRQIIGVVNNNIRNDFKLKEIWHRTDEDTYKKVYIWSEEFNKMIPYVKGYISRKEYFKEEHKSEIEELTKLKEQFEKELKMISLDNIIDLSKRGTLTTDKAKELYERRIKLQEYLNGINFYINECKETFTSDYLLHKGVFSK